MAGEKTPKERKFVSASKSAAATEVAKKREKKAAANDEEIIEKVVEEVDEAPERATKMEKTPKARANGMRIISVILWVAAFAVEALLICLLNGILYIPGDQMVWLIGGIALDLIFVVIGSLLWKKANRIDPASKKNKVKFFLWNNMGVIASVIAFLPLVIILLKDKKLNAKTKKVVSIVAAIALVAAVVLSLDYNPVSSEDLEAAEADAVQMGDGNAYWTRWGRSYHFDPDCQSLLNSEIVYQGSVDEAFDAKRTDPCDFCAGGADAE
ncbi:MAG: hypothetical protein PHV32_03025 [Eubacteriales bacterium]|nr:hypothetical protein [Eubacteriales bacterium]